MRGERTIDNVVGGILRAEEQYNLRELLRRVARLLG